MATNTERITLLLIQQICPLFERILGAQGSEKPPLG
jgi:hypothetical protein